MTWDTEDPTPSNMNSFIWESKYNPHKHWEPQFYSKNCLLCNQDTDLGVSPAVSAYMANSPHSLPVPLKCLAVLTCIFISRYFISPYFTIHRRPGSGPTQKKMKMLQVKPFSVVFRKYNWQGTHKTESIKCIYSPENQWEQSVPAFTLKMYSFCICLNLNKSTLVLVTFHQGLCQVLADI